MEIEFPNNKEKKILLDVSRNQKNLTYLGRKIAYLHPKIYDIMFETYRNFRMLKYFGFKNYFFGSTKGKVDFLIVGFSKSGTSSLYQYLKQHPKIFGPWIKEPHFFSYGYNKGLNYYRKNFRFHKDSMHFESSTDYIVYPEIFKRIKKYNPQMKFIVCLRNPVEQVYSSFNDMKQAGTELNSFEGVLSEENFRKTLHLKRIKNKIYTNQKIPIHLPYLYFAEYHTHIKTAFEIFERQNFFFVDSKELNNDTKNIVKKILDFLDLEKIEINSERYNVKKYEQKMSPEMRVKLSEHFEPFNNKLESLLNQKFDW
jgi:hypothetical protein